MKSYYKNWKFYILALALMMSVLVVLVNTITGGAKGFIGSFFWLLLAILFYYSCSSIIKGIDESKSTLVNVSLVLACLADVFFVFLLFTMA